LKDPKSNFPFDQLKVTVTDGRVHLSRDTASFCPRWEQRLRSKGWSQWGLWTGSG